MANFDPAFDKMIRNEGGFNRTLKERHEPAGHKPVDPGQSG